MVKCSVGAYAFIVFGADMNTEFAGGDISSLAGSRYIVGELHTGAATRSADSRALLALHWLQAWSLRAMKTFSQFAAFPPDRGAVEWRRALAAHRH